MTSINYTLVKKALLSLAVAFFAFNTLSAQQPLPLSEVNSASDEMHPLIHPSGDLYLTRVYQAGYTVGISSSGDIWKSSYISGHKFSTPVKVEELATDSYDQIIGFPDDETAYVFHHQYEGAQGIFVYQQKDGFWQMDSALNIPGLRSLGADFNGRLSKNGKIILMSMQSFGSYGNEDLYVSRLDDITNLWSRPINLGNTINSTYQELTPYYREEDETLFFSSNRPGEGSGYQLFYSLRMDDSFTQWSYPVPLTFLDGLGVTLSFMENPTNGDTFFTSTNSSEGYGDIFILPTEIRDQIFNTVNNDQQEKKQAKSVLTELVKVEEAAIPDISLADRMSITKETTSIQLAPREKREQWINQAAAKLSDFSVRGISSNGEILSAENISDLDSSDGIWILNVSGYIPLTVDWNQPFSMEILTPVEPGSRLDLTIVQFDRSSFQLSDSLSIGYINALAEFLISSPTIKIGLEGHTDNLGNVKLNKTLSTQRASQIRDLLVKQGVGFERIRVSGFGGTRPIADNKTEVGRILNRRVELVVLEN